MSDPNFVGTTIGQYRIEAVLSMKGGMGDVYRGEHINLGKEAAIKVIKVTLASSDAIEEFKQEAQLIARLDTHPNIVHIEDYGLTFNGWPYIAMPLAAGDLKARMQGRKLALDEVLTYAIPVAQALYYAHQLIPAKVHRDVKPDNVLISKHGEVWLSDFGIAVDTTSGTKELRNLSGTYAYMAPEQFEQQPRRATDQYALAIMVYQMFCNALPFYERFDLQNALSGWYNLHLHKPVPSFQSNGVLPDPEVEAVLKRALAKKPDDRYETILDFVNALEAIRTKRIHQAQRQQEEEAKHQQETFVQGLQNQLAQANTEKQRQLQALQREVEEKQQQERIIQTLSQQLEAANNRIIEIESQLEAEDQEDDEEQSQQEALVQNLENQLRQANRASREKQGQLQALQRELAEKRQQEEIIQRLETQLEAANTRLAQIDRQSQAQDRRDDGAKRQQEAIVQGLQNQLTQANRINNEKQHQLQALQQELEEKLEQEAVIQRLTTELETANTRLAEIDRQLRLQKRTDNAEKRRQEAHIQQLKKQLEEANRNPIVTTPPAQPLRPTQRAQPLIRQQLPELPETTSNRRQLSSRGQRNQVYSKERAKALFEDAGRLVQFKRYKEALAMYDQAIQFMPDYYEAHFRRGNVLFQLKRYKEALAVYDQIKRITPNNPYVDSSRGGVLFELKRYQEALAAYDQSVRIWRDSPGPQEKRGDILYELKRYVTFLRILFPILKIKRRCIMMI